MSYMLIAIWLLLTVLSGAISWLCRDRLGTCRLRSGYAATAWHYHGCGPLQWWTHHV